MDVPLPCRLQFAAATMFHFLFVPLTLGLSLVIACMETRYMRTGDETCLSMTKFWGKLLLINFALGEVTGITRMGWLIRNRVTEHPLFLKIMLTVALIFVPIVLYYQIWAYNLFKDKISPESLANEGVY